MMERTPAVYRGFDREKSQVLALLFDGPAEADRRWPDSAPHRTELQRCQACGTFQWCVSPAMWGPDVEVTLAGLPLTECKGCGAMQSVPVEFD
jgi:hypothetical protein